MVSFGALLAAMAGCTSTKVRWDALQAAPGDTTGVMELTAEGRLQFSSPQIPATPPMDSLMCAGSVVFAKEGDQWYATWLRSRADSTVAVVAARSDGRAWTPAAIVDSLDAGRFGCRRPSPSIAVAQGYVHIAYSLKAPEGFGVFFAHSMDRATTFHDPMIVVYGDRLSATTTAAHGMRVAIAYEDPNRGGKRIDVALSETQGHTFEPREPGSPSEMEATQPRIAIRDSVVALSFAGGGGIGRAVRVGHIP